MSTPSSCVSGADCLGDRVAALGTAAGTFFLGADVVPLQGVTIAAGQNKDAFVTRSAVALHEAVGVDACQVVSAVQARSGSGRA